MNPTPENQPDDGVTHEHIQAAWNRVLLLRRHGRDDGIRVVAQALGISIERVAAVVQAMDGAA